MRHQRWVCPCGKEWAWTTGPETLCVCGRSDAQRVTVEGYFDSTTPAAVSAGQVDSPAPPLAKEATVVTPPPFALVAALEAEPEQDWIGLGEGAWR